MKKLLILLTGLILGTLSMLPGSASANPQPSVETASVSRIVVRARLDNLRQMNPGPLKEPLIKFIENLTEQVVLKIDKRGIYAAKSTEEADAKVAIILNAANANQLLDISLKLGPNAENDPHFLIMFQLKAMQRQPDHASIRPAFTAGATRWEHNFRLTTDMSLSEAASNFAEAASIAIVEKLKQ